jgi:hypothetical protein
MHRSPRLGRLLPSALVVLVGLVAGCRRSSQGAGSAAAGCGPAFQEHLDPRSTSHLFPGAAEPTYLSDPPTSGPHQLGQPQIGIVTAPIPRPSQVAMLETGYVIVQYFGLSPADEVTLGGLAGPLVTVAPAAAPLPAPVVATAWTWKETCRSVDADALAALRTFITTRRGKGFSHT